MKEIEPSSWIEKGARFGNGGLFEEALRCFNKALELDPKDADAWYNKVVEGSSLQLTIVRADHSPPGHPRHYS